jgi:hypothetical protein
MLNSLRSTIRPGSWILNSTDNLIAGLEPGTEEENLLYLHKCSEYVCNLWPGRAGWVIYCPIHICKWPGMHDRQLDAICWSTRSSIYYMLFFSLSCPLSQVRILADFAQYPTAKSDCAAQRVDHEITCCMG